MPRASANSPRCTASQCKAAHTAARAAARAALPVIAPCEPKAEPTTCFKIKEVLGVSMCTEKMTDEESRCGRARSDEEICYQLRGKFGKSSDEDVDDMVPGTRWVKLTDWSRTSTKLAVREGMHGAPSHPTKRLHKSPCSPSAAKILPLRGAKIAAPCGARYLSWGEARRKRLQVRTKSTKTRSSPRRFWKSRSRSSILQGAPARQLAMHWATPGEQWLLPLRHSSSGAWLKPCP